MKLISYAFLIPILTAICTHAQTVVSPSGKVAISFGQNPGLEFRVEAHNRLIFKDSPIRLKLGNGYTLGVASELISFEESSFDETWEPVVKGRRNQIRNHYREIHVLLREPHPSKIGESICFEITARAYDDGVAFKYRIPNSSQTDWNQLLEDTTEFRFYGNPTCWAADHKRFLSHQEEPYNKSRVRDLPEGQYIGSPFVLRFSRNRHAAITEAALVDFSAFYLEKGSIGAEHVSVRTKLTRHENNPVAVQSDGTIESSWRAVMVAQQLSDLYTNDMLLNLNVPCAIEDTSWIKPGMMAWDHWWSGGVKMNTETIKEYIQLAADMGWDYQLIDWQWYGVFDNSQADFSTVNRAVDMDEVLRFAKEKGIKLWLWMCWTDTNRNDAYLDAFQQFENWGIAGVKIDFMQRDDQWMVNWYHKIVKAAAEHQLMVNFHGAYKPTGWRRTYPNLITREGVLGQEHSKWSRRVTPEHNCTLLFTRNLLGEMDYTPGGFLNRTAEDFVMAEREGGSSQVMGTRAHNLALFVLFESPVMCACDHPDHYRDQSGADFLEIVPTVWDETICLDGRIGEFGVLAKQSGEDWFLGAITNEKERTLEVSLDFLGDGNYEMKIWQDGSDAADHLESLEIVTRFVQKTEVLELQLAPSGGVVVHFKKL